jgi:LysM repeat protein
MNENEQINAYLRDAAINPVDPMQLSPEDIARVNDELAVMGGAVNLTPKPLPKKKWKAKEFKGGLEDLQAGYKVQKGDTLWSISKKTGISVDELLKANGLKDAKGLRAGATLAIPSEYLPNTPSVLRVNPEAKPAAMAPSNTKHSMGQWGGKPGQSKQEKFRKDVGGAMVVAPAVGLMEVGLMGAPKATLRATDKVVDTITAGNEAIKRGKLAAADAYKQGMDTLHHKVDRNGLEATTDRLQREAWKDARYTGEGMSANEPQRFHPLLPQQVQQQRVIDELSRFPTKNRINLSGEPIDLSGLSHMLRLKPRGQPGPLMEIYK